VSVTVNYVPGLCWVGIKLDDKPVIITIVDPESSRLKKKLSFLTRATQWCRRHSCLPYRRLSSLLAALTPSGSRILATHALRKLPR
jgi:hypothetical protein